MFFQGEIKTKRQRTTLPDKSENLLVAIGEDNKVAVKLLLTQFEQEKIAIDLDYLVNQVKAPEFDKQEAFSLLCFAIYKGYLHTAKLLIENGIDVNKSGKYAQTPLQLAVLNLLGCVYDEG